MNSVTYDTLVPGTGNGTHSFSLPQFNPTLGTLVSAKINSVVSVNYGFTLKNVETIQRDFSVSVGRYDYFSGTNLTSPYSNLLNIPLGSFVLNPGEEVFKAPYNILYRYVNSDSLTSNMVDFLGTGAVNYAYKPITYTNLTGSNTYYYSATANDTVQFSITYYYCNSITLLSQINDFSALKQNAQTVSIAWNIANEQAGREYTIQKSLDGYNFSGITSISSVTNDGLSENYNRDYNIAPGENRLLYFRLKVAGVGGLMAYSTIKTVDMSSASTGEMYLYPNPSNQFVNIVFNQSTAGNWLVEILSTDGKLLQSNSFPGALAGRVDFLRKPASGVYFARVTDRSSLKSYVLKFVVQ
ncbi:MAG TPA: T9SS type A sorting domain-containing protein [Puia sp.]|nr:T9SS type A sorting domain-containing protein [Puia sp.]